VLPYCDIISSEQELAKVERVEIRKDFDTTQLVLSFADMSDVNRLSSLSTRTLVQVIERKRLSAFPGAPLPASQLSQITRNLETLREGITSAEREGPEQVQAVTTLRQQWERMRDMLGEEGKSIPE
jgi:hypothetical protein